MGGSDIVVPEGVEVELGGFALLGGNDLKVGGAPPRPGAPVVRVRAFSLMGGTDVKTKASAATRHHHGVLLRLADPDERYAAVRLCSDLPLPGRREYARHNGEWRLELARRPWRGWSTSSRSSTTTARPRACATPATRTRRPARSARSPCCCCRATPRPVAGGRRRPGQAEELSVRGRGLGAEVDVRVWSPADAGPGEALPLLVAHDGPEYDRLAGLTQFAAVGIGAGALPRHRVALLAPGERNEWYSASARYAGALVRDVLPAIRSAVGVDGAVVGMGASLGALAMLHAQRRHPGTFGALFLQSGSFFTPRFDSQESGFPRYQRIVRFVRATHREGVHADPVPVVLTCGTAEENVHNNRVMARTLSAQGYAAVVARGARPAQLHRLARRLRAAPDEPARAHVVSGRHTELWSDAIGASGAVMAYGHYGRPVVAFPAERGEPGSTRTRA